MRAFAAVFAREIFERRIVFPVALAVGFFPLLVSLVTGWSRPNAAEILVLTAFLGACGLSVSLALLHGASMIAGETKEKRISFFFSRPLPAATIWGGKLLAALVLTLAAAALAFSPTWLAAPGRSRGIFGFSSGPGQTLLAALGIGLVVVLGSHAVVTIGRLRSPWVALDLTLAPALVFFAAVSVRSLVRNAGGGNPVRAAMITLAAALLLALVVAPLVQVAEGRTDVRRAHGAFSVVFFGICAAAVALVGGYAWWCASAKATDLDKVEGGVWASPRGYWVAATGPLRGWRGGGDFLFDTAGGRSLRIRSWTLAFSQDGSRAAWGEPRFGFLQRRDNRLDLFVADLATGRAVATGLETAVSATLALSPSGRRLAALEGKTLEAFDVSDTRNPRQLAAFGLSGDVRGLAFFDEDTIRLYPRIFNAKSRKDLGPASLEITELSLPSKQSLVTGRFDRETLPLLRLSADGRYLGGTRKAGEDGSVLTLHDGRTGVLIATLATDLRIVQARFLTGNRIAVAGIAGARARVDFFEVEKGWGAPFRSTDLGSCARVVLGREIAAGRVAIALLPFEENLPALQRAAKLAVVDAATGAVSDGPAGLVPADRFSWWLSPVLPPAEPGSPASLLFLDADGRLVRLDPATGARTVLLGKGK